MTNRLLTCLLLVLIAIVPLQAQQTYQMPPAEVAALVDAPAAPGLQLSPDRTYMLLLRTPGVPSIEDLAQPELRLGGIRINPANNGPSRAGYVSSITIAQRSDLSERSVTGLPANAVIQNVSISPDSRQIAFVLVRPAHLELWIAEVSNARARRLGDFQVNNTWQGSPFQWSADSQSLLVRTVPTNRGSAPSAPIAPVGPIIQVADGQAAPARTYQDLLSNPHDEALFDHYFTSQLVRSDLRGRVTRLGQPGVYATISTSPDERYLLATRIEKPYSYTVPANRFPTVTEVWQANGSRVAEIVRTPLFDNISIAANATQPGRRSIGWQANAPATLFFVEAQDGGDPRTPAEIRDIAYLLESPFNGQPSEVVRLQTRYSGIAWSDRDFAMISESWRANRTTRTWLVRPGSDEPARLLIERNYEDNYGNPGTPEFRTLANGRQVVRTSPDGSEIYMTGTGASPEGNRPFLRAMNLQTGEFREIWRSQAPWFEQIVTLTNDDATQFITRRESNDTPPNFAEWNLSSGESSVRDLTQFPHPTPHLRDVQTEFVTYTRADGITLSGQLLLPPGYDAARDGALPLMLWAYPREFASADAAGQVSDSPHRFNAISFWGPHFLVTQGYAVLNNAAMPIVATSPDVEPNDNFLEQLIMNAEAAINYLSERGVADPNRVAVGGHSYGAFMTANLLAHTQLFKAGIARSGAYNRSLTPFGFQAEPRSIWEAQDTYITMSPFFHAEKIKTPILFIHGEADNNSGTFPIQSERMFQAVRGNGGIARLVMLPHESHGYRGRESLMHMLWETIEWLDTYVK